MQPKIKNKKDADVKIRWLNYAIVAILNIALLVSAAIVYVKYFKTYEAKIYEENLHNIERMNTFAKNNASHNVKSWSTKLDDITKYIESANMTEEVAIQYIYDANSDTDILMELIAPDYSGLLAMKEEGTDDFIVLNYSHHDYGNNLKIALDDVHDSAYDGVCIAPEFTEDSTAQDHFALYRHVTLKNELNEDVIYTILLAMRTEYALNILNVQNEYKKQSVALFDTSGNYIIKNSEFKAANFFKYIASYNELSLDQRNELANKVNASNSGVLYYKNTIGEDCVFTYEKSDNGWYCVTSVPLSAFGEASVDSSYTWIIVGLLMAMFVIDMCLLISINKRLSTSAAETEQARLAADTANAAKSSFLSHMSHEMRTPLNAIIGMEKLAEEKATNPETHMFLNKINVASTHLLNIINDVLDFSKISEGKLTIHNEQFSMQKLCSAIQIIYDITAKDKSISLVFNTDIRTERYIVGDEMRIRQVLVNLISNAIKYNNKGGYVSVYVNQVGEIEDDKIKIHFEVEDNGFGISEENLKTMFEPFTRDYTDKTKSISGSGLGLSISTELVKLMGGEIQAESEIDKGSRFFFELTFDVGGEIDVDAKDDELKEWSSDTLKGLRIMVVEDNEMNAYIAKSLLEKVGAEVETVSNGKLAVDNFKMQPEGYYDMILMDILMPVMDGYTATKAIQDIGTDYAKNIPIAALSANAFREDVENSLLHGMVAHLVKPIELNDMYKTIVAFTRNKES